MTAKKNSWIWPSFGALIMWGGWAFLPKLAMQTMSPQSVLFYEMFGDLAVMIPVLFFIKGKLEKDRRGILITAVSSVVGVLSILVYYHALKVGPVGTIVTMTSMYPVVALVLAWLFLKEKINRMQGAAICLALVSIYLLAG